MTRIAIFGLFLALSAAPVHAATYFVSPSGNDANSCESAQSTDPHQQKLTIASSVTCLVPGDTLFIHGGTYSGRRNTIDSQTRYLPSGESFDQPITIAGFPGETVILMPPNNTSGVRLTSGSPHHLILRDFTIDMANSTSTTGAEGIFLYTAHHIRFERLEVRNAASFGVHFGERSPYNEVLNCRIHDNGVRWGDATNGHGLYISSSNNLFDGNEVYDNQGYGFHIYSNWGDRSDPSNNVVSNNRIYGNGRHGGSAYGLLLAWGDGNIAYDNDIFNNVGGVQVYTNASNTMILNNSIRGNAAEGIALQYYGSSVLVSGNSVYENGVNIRDYGGIGERATISGNAVD